MTSNRRAFLTGLAGTLAASAAGSLVSSLLSPLHAGNPHRIRAIAFDAFPIFDPRPIYARAEDLFPGKGKALSDAWRLRQFEYQWLRALAGQYVDFWRATEDALIFAATSLKLDLKADHRRQLMDGYLQLKAWPDVPAALKKLRDAGYRLAFLSNATNRILESGVASAGLDGYFDKLISTDAIRTYKPDPRAYQLGVEALQLTSSEILFVAFAGWDVAGAKWFGYPTFWVNRLQVPAEGLGVNADGSGSGMPELVHYLGL